MLHAIASFLARLVYGLRVSGRAHLPESGPALIVCNHVSYADGALLLAASRRKIRFIIDERFVNRGILGWFLRRLGAIPMPRSGPKGMRASMQAAVDILTQGEIVVIFPEAYPTRCGAMLPFHRGFAQIAADANSPVVPACIDRMWGSRWGYSGGKLLWKRSQRGSGRVRVRFGSPLPRDASAFQARSTVQELLAQCAIDRAAEIRPVHRTFVRNAARHPFRPCLIDTSGTGRELNYGKALTGALCLAKLLRPILGVEHMVGIWLPSSTGGVLANLALCLLGKTAVNLNYTAGTDAVQSSVRQCQLRHVLTSKKFLAKVPGNFGDDVKHIVLEDLLPQVGRWTKLRYLLSVIVLPGGFLEQVLGLRKHKPDQLATVVFSSGSTGEPKGILLTHANIASNVDAFLEHAQFVKADRVLGVLPFFHSFGYTVTLWGPLVIGASALYLPDPRAAKEVGEWAAKTKSTVMAATATFMRFYLRRCNPDDFKSMRLMVCGAEKLPMSLADEFAAKFGVRPLEGYGCTELSPVVSVNMPDETIANLTQIRSKNGTIGQPLPGIACKIVHPDTGEPLPENTEGLLLVTGPNVMQGYLRRDDLTAKALRDGWYITGDIGHIDAAGFIALTGRQSRFAKVGGEMVPLERLEEELQAILNSNDRLVAVTSVPDEKKGERIMVLHLELPEGTTPKSLLDGLTARGLPNLWVPGERDFFKIEHMPLLGTGKLDLQKLKQLAMTLV
jgi:acyl-[acyl-carrier-protein]-phospholipid O-acyltransferase/long-chain-fatty-acid--[acyl-carrier-protein] ligase